MPEPERTPPDDTTEGLREQMKAEICGKVRLRLDYFALAEAAEGPLMLSAAEAESIADIALSVRWEAAVQQAAEVERLRAELADRDELLEKYRETFGMVVGQREEAKAERDAFKAAIERTTDLQKEIEHARAKLAEYEGTRATSDYVCSGNNVFVRYGYLTKLLQTLVDAYGADHAKGAEL
jgi:hypothetical protein